MQHPSYEASPRADLLPAWARAADVACALLALTSAAVLWSGGFRVRVGSWHVAVTSPARLIAAAAALVGLRHLVVREPTMLAHIVSRTVRMARDEAIRTGVLVAVVTPPLFWLIGALALSTIGYAPDASPFHEFSRELLNLPLRWDAGWYLQIATNGYEFVRGAPIDLQQNIVFFPAYPLIVRLVALLGGKTMAAYVVGGVLVSVGCLAIALAYFHRVCRTVLDGDRSATAVWLAALYPFALFFGAIYTESLYFAATAGAFYHFDRRERKRAAAWAFVAGVTRPQGCLFALPLAVAAAAEARATRRWSWSALAVVAAPLLGVICYSVFVWRLTGSPIAWATGHAAWGRHYTRVTQLVTDRYDFIARAGLSAYVVQRPYDLLNALGLILAAASVVPLAVRFRMAWAVFVAINVLPGLFSGGLLSMGRFSSVAFPAFVWLADIVPIRQRPAWFAAFAALQALNAALFYTWRPLF